MLVIGLAIGVLYGAFGAGGSAFATPLLALAGVPAVMAIASPLPATIPAALAGAWSYRREGVVTSPLVRRSIVVGLPAAVAGALVSSVVSGQVLLVLSGVLLVVIGVRFLAPTEPVATPNRHVLAAATACVGFTAGLLANSGGFLLVPVFVLLAGLGIRQAASSSLLVAAALSVPTLVTHWALGHVDWWVALVFALGLVPGTVAGTRVGSRLPPARTQRLFGAVLVLFAGWFLLRTI